MARKIRECTHCKPGDDDCQHCGLQGFIGSCDDLECQEYGHGSNQCTAWVSNDELQQHKSAQDYERLKSLAKALYDDVMPQVGKLTINDYAGLNELGILLNK